MDLVVDLNFRMDTSALYSDIVLPAATWYEKADLNSTDMHSFIHPLSAAVPPCWESKSDWQIFRAVAKKFSELAARHFPEPVRDIVATPLAHDSPAEIAQPSLQDWSNGEVEAIPGKTMPGAEGGHARLRQPLQPVHLVRAEVREERAGRARHALREVADEYDQRWRRCGRRSLGRPDVSVAARRRAGLRRDPAAPR
jgi:anaerobic selenocysteine-containing dehydrogenase